MSFAIPAHAESFPLMDCTLSPSAYTLNGEELNLPDLKFRISESEPIGRRLPEWMQYLPSVYVHTVELDRQKYEHPRIGIAGTVNMSWRYQTKPQHYIFYNAYGYEYGGNTLSKAYRRFTIDRVSGALVIHNDKGEVNGSGSCSLVQHMF